MNAKITVLCLITASLGWFQPVYAADTPAAEVNTPPTIVTTPSEKKVVVTVPAALPKVYEYKLVECVTSNNTDVIANCMNSMARQGWRVLAPWGGSYVIFER